MTGLALALAGCGGSGGGSSDSGDDTDVSSTSNLTLAELGERIFFDENLSEPTGQSCGSCHQPTAAFADPDSVDHLSPVSEGAVASRVGSRNAPTAGYTAHIPDLRETPPGSGNFVGGQFVDGRAATLEEQARAPFLNPLEMNMADEAAVVARLSAADYADDFRAIFGDDAFDDAATAYTQMVTAIAAFERTDLFSPFNSKFDAVMAGTESFTPEEQRGLDLFNTTAGCRRCHNTPGARPQVFSDFRYTNIGVPANPDNPFLILNPGFVDNGLGDVQGATHNGKFRAPTLRNVADTAPYMHNGVFDSLEEVMDFYNVRPDPPEVTDNLENPGNATPGNIGNLGLSAGDISDVIAFMRTLSDR